MYLFIYLLIDKDLKNHLDISCLNNYMIYILRFTVTDILYMSITSESGYVMCLFALGHIRFVIFKSLNMPYHHSRFKR